MSDEAQSLKEQITMCHCSGITEEKFKALIANKINTLEEIANATGAITGCGACEAFVLQLIKDSE
jgi:bacterioferritin-associated ferredoxin